MDEEKKTSVIQKKNGIYYVKLAMIISNAVTNKILRVVIGWYYPTIFKFLNVWVCLTILWGWFLNVQSGALHFTSIIIIIVVIIIASNYYSFTSFNRISFLNVLD